MHERAGTIPQSQALENRLVRECFPENRTASSLRWRERSVRAIPNFAFGAARLEGCFHRAITVLLRVAAHNTQTLKSISDGVQRRGKQRKGAFPCLRRQIQSCKNAFDPGVNYECGGPVTITTLYEILDQAKVPAVIDFLSIDVEGRELDVLKGLDIERYKPRLILVEYHVYSLELHRYFVKSGYKLIRRTKDNNLYIPAETKYPIGWIERLMLFRKMYLGTPLRRIKLCHELRRARKNTHAK